MKKVIDFKRSLANLTQQLETLQRVCPAQGQEARQLEELFKSARRTVTDLADQAEEMMNCYLYGLMTNHAGQALSLINRNYIYEAVNDAYCHLHQRSREEIIGQSTADLWGRDAFDTIIKPYLERCFNGEVVRYRHRVHPPQAAARCLDVVCHPGKDDNEGQVTHIVVVVHDVTVHKLVEERLEETNIELNKLTKRQDQALNQTNLALKYSETKYRAVVQQTADALMLIQPQTLDIIETNRALEQMLGYEAEELQALTVYDVADHPKEQIDYHIQRVLEENLYIFGEGKYRHRNGNLIPVEISANLITFNGFRQICVFARNITDRKRAENEIKAANARYRRLLGSVTDYVYTVEVDAGRVISTTHSPGCVAITGYEPSAFTTDPDLWWRVIHEADRAAVITHTEKVMAGESVEPIEHRLVHRDGSLRWVRNTSVLKWDDQMKLIGYDGLITDVTSRKQAELALKESEAKFRTLAETTAAAIFIYKHEKNVYVNPAATTITGYSETELLAMNFWGVLHPDLRETIKLEGLARQQGEPTETRRQLKLLRKDGQTRWIDVTLGLVNYQGQRAVLGTAFDITQQKLFELEREQLLQEEQQQRQHAEMLSRVFLTLTSTLDLECLLDEILTQTCNLIPCSGVNIALLAEDTLLALRWQGYDAFDGETLFVDRAQALSDYPLDSDVIDSGQPVIVTDTEQTAGWIVQPGFEWIRAFIAIPLRLRQKTLGLLRLDGETPHQFPSETLDILNPLANAAAIAINNAQLYDKAQNELQDRVRAEEHLNKLNQKLFTLQYIGATIASTFDVETILRTVSQETKHLLEVEGCLIADWKRDVNMLTVRIEGDDAPSVIYDPTNYPTTQQVLSGQQAMQIPINRADLHPAELEFMQRLGAKTLLMLPMEHLNRVSGLLKIVDSRPERNFSQDEIALAQYLANYAATALENANLYAELKDHLKQQYAIHKATLAIASSLDYETVLNIITKQLGEAVNATSAYLSHYETSTRRATVLSEYYGPRSCAAERVSDVGIAYTLPNDYRETDPGLVDLPELVHVDDPHLHSDHRAHLEQFGAKTTLNFPLRIRGQIVGIAEVWESERKRNFTAAEITLGQGIAQYAGLALENARLYHQAQEEIAERKLVERELRHLAHKNKTLLDAIPDLMFYYDREGRILDYKVVSEGDDLPPGFSPEIMRGQRLPEMGLPVEFVETALQKIDQALETGSLQHYEYQLPVNQGIQDFEARIVPSRSNEVLAIIRNITLQKQAERALRRSEANLRAIFDNSQQAFILIDRDYHIQAYNKAARLGLKLATGRRLQEGESINQLVSAERAKQLKNIFSSVLIGETFTVEERHTLGERKRWFEFIYSPVSTNDGQILGICLSILDIDERKRMTNSLAEREARLLAEIQSILMTTRALATEVNIKKLLKLIIDQARSLTQAKGAAILGLSEDNEWLEVATTDPTWHQMKPSFQLLAHGPLIELAIATQQVQIMSQVERDDERMASLRALLQSVNINALLCAPLIAQGEELGVLLVWYKRKHSFSDNSSRLMELFADQAALAWHNARLHARNQELAIKQERQRLARELHDSVTQSLYSIGMAAQASLRLLPTQESDLHEPLEHIHDLSQIALTEIHEQVFNLRPTTLVEKGLVTVLTEYCTLLSKKHDLAITFETNLSETLPLTQQEHLYYIVREALWNIVKHADANRVEVNLSIEDEFLALSISDDGQGFEPTAVHSGLGLSTMRERAKLLQGQMTIQSQPHNGSQISVRAPFTVTDTI